MSETLVPRLRPVSADGTRTLHATIELRGEGVLRLAKAGGWVAIALGAVVVLFIGGGTAAALCKFQFDCHLRPTEPPPTGIEDFTDRGTGEFELAGGFVGATVASGLHNPTDFDFLPDGRILVAEKAGLLRTVADGVVEPRPVLDIRQRVNAHFFRGVVDVRVDPDFPGKPYVYVSYVVRGPGGAESKEHTVGRFSRFTVRDGRADPASEMIIIGRDGVAGKSCRDLPRGSDCIPADGEHIGSDVVFAPDGTMFVSTGDGGGLEVVEPLPFLTSDPDTLGGKVLHIDREGRGLPGNPWWNGDPTANRSKVWATGFRNMFRMAPVPGQPDQLIGGDVGWDSFEELDVIERGADYGWPCFEGPERTPKYEDTEQCARVYEDGSPTEPWLSMPQPEGASVTAGVPLAGARGWPEEYADRYLFGDWFTSELFTVALDTSAPAEDPARFATNAAGPVAFAIAPDGSVYYLAANVGEIRRLVPPE
jgi:glucose/arabinose dehydrogenase